MWAAQVGVYKITFESVWGGGLINRYILGKGVMVYTKVIAVATNGPLMDPLEDIALQIVN